MHYVARKISYVIDEKLAVNDTMEFGSPQKYKCLSFDETDNGNTVIKWESRCRECGESFTCNSPADYTNGLVRNCKEHRQKKGYSVRKQRQKADKSLPKAPVTTAKLDATPKPDKAKSDPNIKYWCWVTDSWLPEAELNRVMAEYKAKQDVKAKKDDII